MTIMIKNSDRKVQKHCSEEIDASLQGTRNLIKGGIIFLLCIAFIYFLFKFSCKVAIRAFFS